MAPLQRADEPHIVRALASPSVFRLLGVGHAPTAEEIARRELPLIGWHEGGITPVDLFVAKHRISGELVSLWLSYGWDHPTDRTRELDTASLSPRARAGEYFEGFILAAVVLLLKGNARRLRWRLAQAPGTGIRRIYARLGMRELGGVQDFDPITREPVEKTVFEITVPEARALLERAGIPSPDHTDGFEVDLATCLRRLG